MYTEQIAAAVQQLVAEGMPAKWGDIFQSLLGDCAQYLLHRGPIETAGPDPDNRSAQTDENYYPTYAINVPEGSTINNWGDDVNHGDVYNVDNSVTNQDNTVTNNNTTETYNGGSITYEGAQITINGGGITIDGTDYCWDEVDVVTGITPSTQPLNVVNSVSLQATVVTSVTLQGSVVTDVDIDTDTCEITVTKESQSSSTGAQSSTASGIMYVDDVDADTTPINVPTDCPP